jgi:peptidoglycan/LPS O-acetylase OafA/YrhL
MPYRADSLLLGVLGAIALSDPQWRGRLLGNRGLGQRAIAILLLGVAYLGWRAPSYWHHLMASVGLTWMALSYLAFLLYTLLYLDSRISRCLQWNWLRALGVIAYGTYLFHEFFLGMSFGRAPWLRSRHNIGLSFIILIVTIAFCQLSGFILRNRLSRWTIA